MKIYTKTGDKGQTSLFGGLRVKKNHLRIEAYGTIDELNSFLGFLRDQDVMYSSIRTQIIMIQEMLFTIGSYLATEKTKQKEKLPPLSFNRIKEIENNIDILNKEIPSMKFFILPGGHSIVSLCHVCRTVCRRAERNVVSVLNEMEIEIFIIKYLNRLSDYLFVLARYFTVKLEVNEIPWNPNKN